MLRRRSLYLFPVAVLLIGIAAHPPSLAQSGARSEAPVSQQESASPQTSAAQQTSGAPRFTSGGYTAELPSQFVGNLIFLPVRVNGGQPSLFELNSTAAATSIDPERAVELGLTGGSSGGSSTDIVRDPVLKLPGLEISFPLLPLFARKDFPARVGQRYQGTIGGDFLSQVVMEADYTRQTVIVYDPGVYKYSGKGTAVPVTFVDGQPIIRAKFSGPKGTDEADFVIDTDLDDGVVFSEPFADAHRLVTSHSKTDPAYRPDWTDSPRNAYGRLKAFGIGPYMAEDVLAVFSQKRAIVAGNSKVAGIIGGGLLKRFDVIFDFAHQQIIFDPHFHFRDYDESDMSGLCLAALGPNFKRFEVVDIVPGSPGANAGIQKGDIIAGIDDEPAADISLASIHELFRQIAGKYKLLIERNGQTRTVELKMRRLV
jgi:PDZ domain-containing protein